MQMRKLRSTISDAAPWLGLTVLIGIVDYFTPPTYAFASIYFIPIFPAAWRSRTVGFIVAAASSFAWFSTDYIQRPVTDPVPMAWNYLTRIVVLTPAVLLPPTFRPGQTRIAGRDPHGR